MKTINAALALPLVLAEWLSAGRHARLICDEQQRIAWHNDRFEELLVSTRIVKVDRDHFTLANKKEQATLTDFMRSEGEQLLVMWLADEGRHPDWVLQGQRIHAPMVPTAFGLRIANYVDFLASDYHAFESFFGLTRQEAAICRFILHGKTVQDIVDSNGKSEDTVRFHIRNIYRKVGVSSREKLLAHLRHFQFL